MSKTAFATIIAYLFGSNQNGWAQMMSAVVAGKNGVRDTKPNSVEVAGQR